MEPRREFLTACGALALAAPPVAVAEFAAEDPHIAWWREHEALEAEGAGLDDEAYAPINEEQLELLENIATTPAATIAGVLIQLRVVQIGIEDGKAYFDGDAIANAMATLEQLGGRV